MPIQCDEIVKCRDANNVKLFIETGTYVGNSALWASQNFNRVITIEADPDIWNRVVERLRDRQNIDFLLGRAHEILPQILPFVTGPVIFWIDSHFSGTGTFGQDEDLPIFKEIYAILDSKIESYFFIDDVNLMNGEKNKQYRGDIWPRANEIESILASAGYSTRFLDQVLMAEKVKEIA